MHRLYPTAFLSQGVKLACTPLDIFASSAPDTSAGHDLACGATERLDGAASLGLRRRGVQAFLVYTGLTDLAPISGPRARLQTKSLVQHVDNRVNFRSRE